MHRNFGFTNRLSGNIKADDANYSFPYQTSGYSCVRIYVGKLPLVMHNQFVTYDKGGWWHDIVCLSCRLDHDAVRQPYAVTVMIDGDRGRVYFESWQLNIRVLPQHHCVLFKITCGMKSSLQLHLYGSRSYFTYKVEFS